MKTALPMIVAALAAATGAPDAARSYRAAQSAAQRRAEVAARNKPRASVPGGERRRRAREAT